MVHEQDRVLGPEVHCQRWNQDKVQTTVHIIVTATPDCQKGSRKASQRSEGPELNLERWLLTEQFCMGGGGSLIRETKPEFAWKSRSNVSFLLHFDLFL